MNPTRRDFVKGTVATGIVLAVPEKGVAEVTGQAGGQRAAQVQAGSGAYTRGVGIYPGAPAETFSPMLTPAGSELRNVALLRPAYQSSAYDYNLTAQLITDGIRESGQPEWVSVAVDERVLLKHEREVLFDHFPVNTLELSGAKPVIEVHLGGAETAPSVDRVDALVAASLHADRAAMQFRLSTSDDGYTWKAAGAAGVSEPLQNEGFPPDFVHSLVLLRVTFPLPAAMQPRFYRLELEYAEKEERPAAQWRIGQVEFYASGKRVEVGGPYRFSSAWKSAGMAEEWVYVDLLAPCALERAVLHWIAPAAEGVLQVSDDAEHWRDVRPLPAPAATQTMVFPSGTKARYVRVWMRRPATAEGYVLSEMEVFGRGGMVATPRAALAPSADGELVLSGGGWKLRRASDVKAEGEALGRAGFDDAGWLPATVPGTVLASYLNAGAIPDPNFGQNQLLISDSYFYSDFWYRTEFAWSGKGQREKQWLQFDGVNWKAEVFLNGDRLGTIEGAFVQPRFDVTGKLRNGVNALAVRIVRNHTPGSAKQKTFESTGVNGGALGADNPTFHSSIGWDWIPTIRGRNTGIWDAVKIWSSGAVTLEAPSVQTQLPEGAREGRADVRIGVDAVNHAAHDVSGTVRLRFAGLSLEKKTVLRAGGSAEVVFDKASHQQLAMEHAELWWPAGYGDPHLYATEMEFDDDAGMVSHRLQFQAGLRQMRASEEGGALRLWVNGKRLVAKGGNWGFSESMLRYGAREFDAAVRYHREMHFNVIRNWVGQIGGDPFYEACDRHGVIVWQDFWLANPWDGPNPDNDAMFLANARELVRRIRRHASVGMYCGRNEGFPPQALERGIRQLLAELAPDLHYIPSSADGPVSGHGPYHALTTENYFALADTKLHSEIGAPCIPPMESVRSMMPRAALWPQGLDWGLHDYTQHGAQGAVSFQSSIDESYGGAVNAEEWVELAQFVNYDVYRAMMEAQSVHRMGVLLWMSHSCWPSFVWQTYDYFLEPTSAYFACKKGAEPLHIQWNALANVVEVVNYSAGDRRGLTARLEILDFAGRKAAEQSATLDAAEDSTVKAYTVQYPAALSEVHFLRLTLRSGDEVLSTNFYMRGRERQSLRALRTLPRVALTAKTAVTRVDDRWKLVTKVANNSPVPALMVRLQVVRTRSRDRILPAIYDDNYIALMPGESRTIHTEVMHCDTRGETPEMVIQGFNVAREGAPQARRSSL